MLKLLMLKENLMKVMGSIAKENMEWRELCLEVDIRGVVLFRLGIEVSKGDTVELNLQCPEYIINKYTHTKEDILNMFTPLEITEDLLLEGEGYYLQSYWSGEEDKWVWSYSWESDGEHIEGVKRYTEDAIGKMVNLLNLNSIKPF